MADIFRITITLLASADSRMPRTRTTVNSITMRNAGMLKPKCQPGAYSTSPFRSLKPDGRYAGEIQRRDGCHPNQSNPSTRWAAKPTLTAMLLTAYSRIRSQPMIQAINSPMVA